jgi:predicted permease
LIWVAATVALTMGAGLAFGQRRQEQAAKVAQRMLNLVLFVIAPPIVFVNIARLEVTPEVGGGLALSWTALALCGGVAYLAARRLRLDRPATGALMACAVHPNTGFLGLPICAALLGREHIDEAIVFDLFVGTAALLVGTFGIGAAFGTRAGQGARERLRAFVVRNPPLWAAVAGLLAPDALAPDALLDASRVFVFSLAPIGFFAAGALLAQERTSAPRPAVATAVVLRIVLAPALLLALAAPLIDIPDAYKLQMAMPVGLNSLAAAHAFGLDTRLMAAAIAWATAIVVAVAVFL